MVWATTVPPEVAALKTMIQLAATWTAWAGGGIHYPQAAITVEHGTPDPFPIALIDPGENRRTKYAAGATGLSGGSISIILYDAIESSDIETKARALLADLLANDVGLALTEGSVGRSTDPTPAQIAVKDSGTASSYFRSITISLSYGLKA